jgi:excinuclease UvrABC nuclease subunit
MRMFWPDFVLVFMYIKWLLDHDDWRTAVVRVAVNITKEFFGPFFSASDLFSRKEIWSNSIPL